MVKFTEKDVAPALIALMGGIICAIVIVLPLNVLVSQLLQVQYVIRTAMDVTTGEFLHIRPVLRTLTWQYRSALAGVVEEPGKVIGLIAIVLMFPQWLNSKTKGLVYGALAGLGFAFIENLWYFVGDASTMTIYHRTLLCIPGHVLWSAIVGMGLVYVASKGREGIKNFLPFLGIAIFLHGMSNAVLSSFDTPVVLVRGDNIIGAGFYTDPSMVGFMTISVISLTFISGFIAYSLYRTLDEYPVPLRQTCILRLPNREIWLTRDEKIFGRNDFSDDAPPEKLRHISKEHFKIMRRSDKFYLEDWGSTGGTKLNGVEIKGKGMQELKDGSEIAFAGLMMSFARGTALEGIKDKKTIFSSVPSKVVSTQLSAKIILPNHQEIAIMGKEMFLGKEDFRGCVPEDELKYISRGHFKIMEEGGKYYILDEGSKNGTTLNGREIKGMGRTELNSGDEITVAGVLKIKFGENPIT